MNVDNKKILTSVTILDEQYVAYDFSLKQDINVFPNNAHTMKWDEVLDENGNIVGLFQKQEHIFIKISTINSI